MSSGQSNLTKEEEKYLIKRGWEQSIHYPCNWKPKGNFYPVFPDLKLLETQLQKDGSMHYLTYLLEDKLPNA